MAPILLCASVVSYLEYLGESSEDREDSSYREPTSHDVIETQSPLTGFLPLDTISCGGMQFREAQLFASQLAVLVKARVYVGIWLRVRVKKRVIEGREVE